VLKKEVEEFVLREKKKKIDTLPKLGVFVTQKKKEKKIHLIKANQPAASCVGANSKR
jgi:hypothetical protein